MAHGERVGGGAAERRRGRRLRVFWRHEQLSLNMMRAAMEHYSWQRCHNLCDAATQTDAAPAPVDGTEYFRMSEDGSDVQEQVTEKETPDMWLFPHERVQQCADDERAHTSLAPPERESGRIVDSDLGVQVETPFPHGQVQQSIAQVPVSMLVSPHAVLESLPEVHKVERASRVPVPRMGLPLVDVPKIRFVQHELREEMLSRHGSWSGDEEEDHVALYS